MAIIKKRQIITRKRITKRRKRRRKMRPLVETREPIGGRKCKTDFEDFQCLFSRPPMEPIRSFFPSIPRGIKPAIRSEFQVRKLGFCAQKMGCYSKHCGMELSSLHCGNGQNLLGGNGIYTVLSFIILIFCLLERLPDCLMCLFFFFFYQAENVFSSCVVFEYV